MIKNSADLFGRVATAMVTPFNDDYKIDFAAVEKLVEHLINTGSSSIVVAGTTGESPTLDHDEKQTLLKAVIKFANKRAKVIMGTGTNDTRTTIKACEEAQAAGADALLVVAPYYNKPNQEGLKAHFSAVAQKTSLPIMIYNIPGRTGANVSPETTLALASEHGNIVALKDSTGGVEQMQEIASQSGGAFRIYSGDDNLTLAMLSVGACGVISVASHLIGNELNQMVELFFAGKLDEARSIHYQYLPLMKGLFIAPNPTCVKYALAKMGLCQDKLRLPLVPLSKAQQETMDTLLKGIKQLVHK